MANGGRITLRVKESEACIRLEAVDVPEKYDVLVFGLVGIGINEVVGEVVDVVQSKENAFGMQASISRPLPVCRKAMRKPIWPNSATRDSRLQRPMTELLSSWAHVVVTERSSICSVG